MVKTMDKTPHVSRWRKSAYIVRSAETNRSAWRRKRAASGRASRQKLVDSLRVDKSQNGS
jgi:hypothetical protein